MDIYEFSKQITNREYLCEVSREEAKWAKDHGIVVVLGRSDDLAEFRGAIEDEADCYNGGRIFERGKKYIDAVWCKGEFTWTYLTNIPHVKFYVFDEGEKYCEGIIFDIKDLEEKPVVLTNFERIKAMNVDEMAEFLEGTNPKTGIVLGGELVVRYRDYIKLWLESEVQVDE